MKNKILHLILFIALSLGSFPLIGQDINLTDNPTLGQILTDAQGNTLYYFTRDNQPDFSACSGGCLNNWPIFHVAEPTVATGLESDDFGAFMREDGQMQSTYKGWPLYYFAGDSEAGQTNGEGVGGIWYVAKPDYAIMLLNDSLVGNDGVTYNLEYEPGSEVVQFFTDGEGRTLYGFIFDTYNVNNYTEEDFSNDGVWPIYGELPGSVPSTLDGSLFEMIDVHGRAQLTYKGWPLYYFGPDAVRGDTKGVSVPSPGVWPIIYEEIEPLPQAENVLLSDDPTLGQILTDAEGKTLYYFTRDNQPDFSACNGGCLDNWPIFHVAEAVVGEGLDSGDFGAFMRSDGHMQSTYRGWPLYYFAGDSEAGQTNGEGVGGIWYVAKPDYAIMLLNDSLVGNDGVTYNLEYEPGSEVVQFFTDGEGRTLYGFIFDTYNVNNYTEEDFSNDAVWPIYGEPLGSIPSTLDGSLFEMIDVHGRAQLTYNGWPLYYFGPDAVRGDTKGVSVPSPGVWPIIYEEIEPLPQAENVLLAEDPTLGQILTDAEGNTLYYFTRDNQPDFSACNGGCLDNWPIFHVAEAAVSDGLESDDFGAFMRGDGQMQSTYKGWPLYYFAGDSEAGQTNGEGVGGIWYVAKPDYAIMLLNDSLVGNDGVTYNLEYEPGSEVVQFFTDGEGRTLYGFIFDTYNVNNYTEEDFSNDAVWPIYGEPLGSIPSTLDAELFAMIDVHGRAQLTYKGWPLYYFGPDGVRGDTKGVSVPSPGVWPVIFKDIEELLVSSVEDNWIGLDLVISPNPFHSEVNIEMDLDEAASIEITIFNTVGKTIHKSLFEQLNNGKNRIQVPDLQQLDRGIYFLNIRNIDGRQTTYKLIKSN